jgi:hypothetical protein
VTTELVRTVVDRFTRAVVGDDPDDHEMLVAEALQHHGSVIATVAVER